MQLIVGPMVDAIDGVMIGVMVDAMVDVVNG